MGGNIVETVIGAVVLLVAAIFVIFAYRTADVRTAGGGTEIIARFDRVDGLNVGSDVRMSGIKVGTVIDQHLDTTSYLAVVRVSLDNGILVPADSAAKIASEGLLGGNYLSIEPGGDEEMLANGGEIKFTQGAVDLMDLIGQAIFSAAGSGSK